MNPPSPDEIITYQLRELEKKVEELQRQIHAIGDRIEAITGRVEGKIDRLEFVRHDLYLNDKEHFQSSIETTRAIAITALGFVVTLTVAFLGYILAVSR